MLNSSMSCITNLSYIIYFNNHDPCCLLVSVCCCCDLRFILFVQFVGIDDVLMPVSVARYGNVYWCLALMWYLLSYWLLFYQTLTLRVTLIVRTVRSCPQLGIAIPELFFSIPGFGIDASGIPGSRKCQSFCELRTLPALLTAIMYRN